MRSMTVRDRRVRRAIAISQAMAESARTEFRQARVGAGLSRADVGRAVDMSPSQVDRFERGALKDVRVEQLCRLAVAVGLSPRLRFFPDGDAVRDAGQIRVFERLGSRLPSTARLRTEVPLHGRSDPRAWDAVLDGHGCVDAFEVETRLSDIQATERRVMLKFRDDSVVNHIFLVVADTKANRAAIASSRSALAGNFPLDTRAVLSAFGSGRCPGNAGLIVL
jgi:transcriptional regulator with XRE-family HTH domain